MLKPVEQVCEELPHFGTIQQEGKDIEIWAKPFSFHDGNQEDYHTAGIYCIENFRLNKIYIGMSKNIGERLKTHRRELNPMTNIVHHNTEMHKDSIEYGFHNFSYGVLETFDADVDKDFLLKREEEWIQYYENQSHKCLYNKVRCHKFDNFDYDYEQLSSDEKQERIVTLGNNLNFSKETKDIVKSVRITESMNKQIRETNLPLVDIIERGLSCSKNVTAKEQIPMEWLISDVLAMKLEAWDIQNKKLFDYCCYLEKKLLGVRAGDIELVMEAKR